MLDCSIVVSKFNLRKVDNNLFQTNTLEKDMNTRIDIAICSIAPLLLVFKHGFVIK